MKSRREEKRKKKEEEKRKEREKNPLHKEYGVASNVCYILKNTVRYEKALLWLIPIGILVAPIMQYLWTFISKFVIDMITGEGDTKKLLVLMAAFTVIQMASSALNTFYYSEYWWRFVNARILMKNYYNNYKVMTIDFEHLENQDVMTCYSKASSSCGGNMNGVEGMMRFSVQFLQSLAIVIVGILILGTLNPWIVLLMLVLGVVNFFVKNRANAKAKEKIWDPLAGCWRKRYYMQETTTNFKAAKDIRMFFLKDWLLKKFQEVHDAYYSAYKKNANLWIIADFISSIIVLLSQAMVYAWLIYSAAKGRITLGNFSLYTASSATLFSYISTLLNGVSDLLKTSREVDDFRSFADLESILPSKTEQVEKGKHVPSYESYEFTFRNVSFRYPKAEKDALKNLNLTLKAGERLAVVGLNGAGKTTFIKLLLRLYEPTEGEIFLNGTNIREFDKKEYYRVFAPVFQEVNLFAFPLAENISMKPPKETDKEKAEQCLIDAGFEEKLAELGNGINTEVLKVIHDDGVDFSGGEKQKIALARALYKNAPVVVLDEPTAALDALAEAKLYEDFDKLIGGKTAVYISHRLSSTQFCNNVAMFKDGEMIEYGTHGSLMELGGEYAKMFEVQAQYYVEHNEDSAAKEGSECIC